MSYARRLGPHTVIAAEEDGLWAVLGEFPFAEDETVPGLYVLDFPLDEE